MLKAGDNELVPVENVQSMPDGTAMDRLLWTVPTNELAATPRAFTNNVNRLNRSSTKSPEFPTFSRASVASETATAQNIKTNGEHCV